MALNLPVPSKNKNKILMEDNRNLKKDIDRIKKFFIFIGDRGSHNLKMELDKLSESIMQYLFKHPNGSVLRNVIKQEFVNW